MKVLLISATPGLYKGDTSRPSYNGGGWISSLQTQLSQAPGVEHALAFVTTSATEKKVVQDGITYYPIYDQPEGSVKKMLYYHGGYKKVDPDRFNDRLRSIIADYKPDIIHLFGLENQMAGMLRAGNDVPIIVHLQGLITPYANAFYPPGINRQSLMFPITSREWVKANGYVFAKKMFDHRVSNEQDLLKHLRYSTGRTDWDHRYVSLLAPEAKYYHVNEILRDAFYENAGKWEYRDKTRRVIASTISDSVFKGLDTVLKTAKVLTDIGFDFEWHVAGVSSDKRIVRFCERATGISSTQVNVIYDGVRTPDQLVEMLLDADVYVHPSYIDNSPNSLCEAQLLGVPVVANYVGGVPSLIADGVTGALCPANDPWSMASKIKEICQSRQLASSISQNGYQTATKRHDKEAITAALLVAYRSIIDDDK